MYSFCAAAQSDSLYLKVHFLYGSKPKKGHKKTESHYFGGLHGGHTTIELDHNDFGFGPTGKVHIVAHKKNLHGSFGISNTNGEMPYGPEEKFTTFYIPINSEQYAMTKKIMEGYLTNTPYDYAFFGMRCAAAANDLLGQIGVLKKRNRLGYMTKSFYPKKLRKRLFKLATKNNWKIDMQDGKSTRKWEKD
jgi:hypothetical protein